MRSKYGEKGSKPIEKEVNLIVISEELKLGKILELPRSPVSILIPYLVPTWHLIYTSQSKHYRN